MTLNSSDLQYARMSPATLSKVASRGRYIIAEHIQKINTKLLEISAGTCKRLIVCMPPRHGKSMLISTHFPPWYLGRFPDRKILLSSYEANIAANWGRMCRDLYDEFGLPVFGNSLGATLTRSDWWETERGGMMSTAGVGGETPTPRTGCYVVEVRSAGPVRPAWSF